MSLGCIPASSSNKLSYWWVGWEEGGKKGGREAVTGVSSGSFHASTCLIGGWGANNL